MTTAIDFSEYAEPELYDLENQEFEPEGPFLLELAQRLGGPVLELGCGSGRITIPLAADGVDITGLDAVPGMLELARQKTAGLPVTWIEADARAFNLPRRFRLVFETGSVFMHMLAREDQEAFLRRVGEHLDEDGRFVFGVMFPHPDLLASEEQEKEWFSYDTAAGRRVRVWGTEFYDPLRQVKLETAYRRWTGADGQPVERVAPLSLRYTFPQEMESLLHYNGFEVLERFGDWQGNPLTEAARMMIYCCRKRD